MKIARVEAIPVRLPFRQVGPPLVAFGRPMTTIDFLVVRVESDDGRVGWGETPFGTWRIVKGILDDFIGPAVTGREVPNVPGFMHQLQRMTYVLGRAGLTMAALSGLDTALWDLAAKAAGQPLCRLFGAEPRKVPAYISLWVPVKRGNAWDVECADPEILAAQTRAALATGCRHVKLHGTAEADLKVIRDAGGADVKIMIDASCRWTLEEARQAADRLRPYDLFWVEEPLFPPEDFASLGKLAAETGMAIAAGENVSTALEFQSMLAARAVSFAQPNVNRIGGVTEFRKAQAAAEAAGVEICPHARFFGPGYLATLQMMAAQARPGMIERAGIELTASLYGAALDPVDGALDVPTGPGLGLEPDPDVLRECSVR